MTNIDIPTPEEIRRSFWKNTIITVIRSLTGAVIANKLILEGYFLKIVAKIDSVFFQIIVCGLLFALLFWCFMAMLELPVNIPSYVAQIRKGCTTAPVIRMYLYEMLMFTASGDKLTLSPSERWVVRSTTDTVVNHLNTRSRK